MKRSKVLLLLVGAGAFLVFTSAQASQVTWGAATDNGVGVADAGGQPLPLGDSVLLGHFNLTNAQITANGNNEAFLMANFVQYASSFIGAGAPNFPNSNTGYWLANSANSSNLLGIQNTQIYYWVFNAPIATNATEYGIFTATTNPSWLFPNDTTVPPTTITDLDQVPHNASGILWGSFGIGTSSNGTSPLYDLASFNAVPEPAAWAGSVLVSAALLLRALFRQRRYRASFSQ